MPKKTATPAVDADFKLPEKSTPAFDREAHFAKIEPMVAAAMKTIPLSGSAIDILRWLKKNSACGYKNLLRAAWAAAGI